jgi:CubicO group peptidase (beta-lactamase class C family)
MGRWCGRSIVRGAGWSFALLLTLGMGACKRSPAPPPPPASPVPAPAPTPNPAPAPQLAPDPANPPPTSREPRFGPEPVVDGPVGTALDEFFKRAVAHGFSGCVLVAVDDHVILHHAYGLADRDAGGTGVPVNLRTRFDVGSISKQFTAAAALRLVMQGKLSLDEPIVRWFDVETLGLIPARNRTITLKHLLSHTSGMPRQFDLSGVDMNDRDAVVANLLGREFSRPPGRTHMYSNANYFILAAVIERASGMPFERAVHELVFEPAGLKDTMFCGEPDPPERVEQPAGEPGAQPAKPTARLSDLIATGYEENEPPEDVDVPMDMGNGHYPHGTGGPAHRRPFAWGHRGATGVVTTPADLLAWHRVLATDGVLTEEMRKLIVTPAIRTYAMGWEVDQLDNGMYMVGHSGSMIGFEADFRRYFPGKEAAEKGQGAKVVTVVCSNDRGGRINAIRQVLERALLKQSDGSAPATPQPPAAPLTGDAPVDPGVLDACLGVYALPTGGEIMVTPGEDTRSLHVFALGQDAAVLIDPPTAHAAPIFSYASRRAEQVLRAWKTGDERDAREQRRSTDAGVSDETLAQWGARWKTCGAGALGAIRPVASFTHDRQLQTVVMLDYGSASELVRVLWKEDTVTAIEPVDALPIGAEVGVEAGWPTPTFASGGEQWWVTLRLVFDRAGGGGASGAAGGVTVKSLGREVRGARVK